MYCFYFFFCTVVSPPVILQDPEDISILLFAFAKFQCIAEGYNANITWTKHDSTLPRTSKIFTRTEDENKVKSILEINNAVGYYAGKYCCIVGNQAGNVSSCANLRVNGMYINILNECCGIIFTSQSSKEVLKIDFIDWFSAVTSSSCFTNILMCYHLHNYMLSALYDASCNFWVSISYIDRYRQFL